MLETESETESPSHLRRAAFVAGLKDALGIPAFVLVAGMLGFGALARASGLDIWVASASSWIVWALPGQVVWAEMFATGAPALAVFVAVSLTSARFLPMTLTLMPHFPAGQRGLGLYPLVHVVSMTTWATMMRRFPSIGEDQRLAYFAGFGLVCWGVSLPATALGFLLSGTVPHAVTLGLVFLNPLFFFLLFADVKQLASRLALLLGGILGPLVYLAAPGWSLPICGVAGGTLAFLIGRWWRRRGG